MANVKLLFSGSELSESNEHDLVCYHNTNNEIYMHIDMPGFVQSWICLDKQTAIKLHRELKKQISFITESEVANG